MFFKTHKFKKTFRTNFATACIGVTKPSEAEDTPTYGPRAAFFYVYVFICWVHDFGKIPYLHSCVSECCALNTWKIDPTENNNRTRMGVNLLIIDV
jgi:hypothetical protein